MKKEFKSLWVVILLVLIFHFPLIGQHENGISAQFRGQHRDGVSLDKIETPNWAESQPKLLWKREIGSGFSEVIISDAHVYTLVAEKTDSVSGFEYLIAYDAETGEEEWRSVIDSIFIDIDGWGDGARSTPIADEDFIYCLSGNGNLSAHTKERGGLVWQLNLVKEYGSSRPRWGFSSSPMLLGDQLILEVGGTDARAFMAFDKKDGKNLWASAKGAAAYSSPLLVEYEGQEQIIFLNGRTLYSYQANGDTLWTHTLPFGGLTAIPVFMAPNKIFLSGVRTPGFVVLQIDNEKAVEVLQGSSMKNDFSSCVYHEGLIYGFNVAALRCISAETGEVKWSKRGFGKGSLIFVDNNLVVLSDKGKMIFVEAYADAYTEKASVQAVNGKSWTAPTYDQGRIYIRNLTEMACYQL